MTLVNLIITGPIRPNIDYVNNKVSLEKSIENVYKNPNEYIEGELFTKKAGKQIQLFYSTLVKNVLLHI